MHALNKINDLCSASWKNKRNQSKTKSVSPRHTSHSRGNNLIESGIWYHGPSINKGPRFLKWHTAYWNCYIKFYSHRTKDSNKLMTLTKTLMGTLGRWFAKRSPFYLYFSGWWTLLVCSWVPKLSLPKVSPHSHKDVN